MWHPTLSKQLGDTVLKWLAVFEMITLYSLQLVVKNILVLHAKLDIWHCMSHSGDDRNIQEVYIAGRMRFSQDELSRGMKLGRVSFSS